MKNFFKTGITILAFLVATHCYARPTRNSFSYEQPHAPKRSAAIIMIDPYGDVCSSGRVIGNRFESELTYACAQKIKRDIEAEYDWISIVISRTAGEHSYELARAQYANRLGVKGFLSLQFFHETAQIARWFVYRYNQNATEFTPNRYSLIAADQAYLANQELTLEWFKGIDSILGRNEQKYFGFHSLCAVPCTPLKGIVAPAVLCEIGLKSPDDWTAACNEIKSIVKALIEMIEAEA